MGNPPFRPQSPVELAAREWIKRADA